MRQTYDVGATQNGRGDSDIELKRKSNLYPRNRGTYIDEALSKTKFGIYNYVLVLLAGLVSTAVFVETCGISFVLPVIDCDLEMTASEKGILSGVSFLGIILSSHLWGYLADTKGRRCIILPTLFVAFLLSCASSLAQNLYLLVSLRFLNGFFISGSAAVIVVYISEFHDEKQGTRAIMRSMIVFSVACLLLPIIAYLVINQDWQLYIPLIDLVYKPWRSFLVVCSLPGLTACIILLFLPESPKFVLSQGNKTEAYDIVRKMYHINNGKSSEFEKFEILEAPDSIANRQRILSCKDSRFPLLKSIWIQTVPLFKQPHLFPTVLLCMVQFGLLATSSGFYLFVPDILNKMAANLDSFVDQRMPMCDIINMKKTNLTTHDHGVSDKICVTKLEIAMVEEGVMLEGVFLVGAVLVSFLVNKLGKFPVLLSVFFLCGSGGYVCMFTDIPFVHVASLIALITCALAVSIVNAATVEIYPTASRAMALCVTQLFGRFGCVAGANVAAFLLDYHCELVFYFFSSLVLGIGILTIFIPNVRDNSRNTKIMMLQGRQSVISMR